MAKESTTIACGGAWNTCRTSFSQISQDRPDDFRGEVAEDDSWSRWDTAVVAVSASFVAAYFGANLFKFIRDRIRVGRATERIDRAVAKRIKAEPSYDVAGSSDLAREAWRKTIRRFPFPAIMIDAPYGEGMEALAEKMIVMKERGDPAVPKRFRDAPVVKLSPLLFRSELTPRGVAAMTLKGIVRQARKGPIIVYIPDFDAMIHEHTSYEGVERILFQIMEDPSIRKNLIVIATTSRKDKILGKYPDLEKRFSWIDMRKFDVSTSIAAEMVEHPAYRDLMPWERAEHAEAMEVMVKELKMAGELHRFMDESTGRFLEGKFDILAKAAEKGGGMTTAELTKAAETVEKSNSKVTRKAEKSAESFAKSKGGKK